MNIELKRVDMVVWKKYCLCKFQCSVHLEAAHHTECIPTTTPAISTVCTVTV